jgi:hypothetical protein
VSDVTGAGSPLSLLTLREIRRYIRRSHAVMMTVTFTVVYALAAMSVGGMLVLFNQGGGYTVQVLWGNALGQTPWLYPGLLVIAPWGYLELPFFATLAMVVVSVGVGIGMAVAVLLSIALVRNRRGARAGASAGTVAGLTPVMLTLVTLGACCSTTAAATAGVGMVAQVSGSTTNNLLLNNWFLGVFQMAIVWVALVAQELVLRVYGGLFGRSASPAPSSYVTPQFGSRLVLSTLLRAGLLVGGVTWSLAMLVEWTTTPPLAASGALWFRWLLEYQLVAFLAILAALFPSGLAEVVTEGLGRWGRRFLRGGLLLGGFTLLFGAPPPFSGWGVEGLGNEILGVLGVPSSLGGVVPVFPPGLDLAFRWGVQYGLLGGFALAIALAPARVFRHLEWTAGRAVDSSGAIASAPPGTPAAALTPAFEPGAGSSAEASSSRPVAAEGP